MATTQKSKAGVIGYCVMVIRSTFGLILKPFKLALLFLITYCITMQFKRILTLTSLYYLLFNEDDSSHITEAVHRINETFHFVNDEDALKLPIVLREILWDEEYVKSMVINPSNPTAVMNEAQLRSISERLVAAVPNCIRWGRREDMLNDLFSVLNVGRINKAKA